MSDQCQVAKCMNKLVALVLRFVLINVVWERPVGFPALRENVFYGQVPWGLGLFSQRSFAVLLLNTLKDQSQSAPRQ